VQRKTDELADAQEELAAAKELSKEREKHLKSKLRAAIEERGRLASVEVSARFERRRVRS